LLVGGINTLVGLLAFISVDVAFGTRLDSLANPATGSILILAFSHAISVTLAFVLHRRFVFRSRGHLWLDFVRFQSVYAITFSINLIALPILVSLNAPRMVAQVGIVAILTVASYVAHRHFSFRRAARPTADLGESGSDVS
jgi:putative flippase GtrA